MIGKIALVFMMPAINFLRTKPAKGSAIGPRGLAAANLAALLLPADACKDVMVNI